MSSVRRTASTSKLSPFITVSVMSHSFVLLIAFLAQPLFKPKPIVKMIAFNLAVETPIPSVQAPNPIPSIPIQKTSTPPKKRQVSPPQAKIKETVVPKPTPVSVPVRAAVTIPDSPPVVHPETQPSLKTPPLYEEEAMPPSVHSLVQDQNDSLADTLEDILNNRKAPEKPAAVAAADFLAGGSWTGSPRKTIAFPNISARIRDLENSRGFGYSVTARITFSPQGWVSTIELTHASGDPRIDNIFRSELRKIRIEESPAGRVDTVMKTFVISVQ